MKILDIALKDLTQIFRDKKSTLFLIAMPVVFTLFMGFAYNSGASDDAASDPRLSLGWVNQDQGGLLSQHLYQRLANSEAVRLEELSHEVAADAVRDGAVTGALIVPAGFSQQIMTGEIAQLQLIADTGSPQGQALFQSLRAPLTQLMSSVEIAQLSAETTGNPAELQPSFDAAALAWVGIDSASLVQVELVVAEPEQAWYGDNPYNQASPGVLVQFAIFGLVTSGQIMVQERKLHTLQRMISTALPAWQIVAGHILALFAVVFIQEMLLVVFGQLALGVNYAHQPLATLVVCIGLGLWIAAAGLLIGVLAKNDSQVVLFSLMAMFIFSALGGTWFPLEVSSGAFAAIGRLLPSAWAMTGFQNILIRGQGLSSAWLPGGILLGYALLFFGAAVWRFRFSDMNA